MKNLFFLYFLVYFSYSQSDNWWIFFNDKECEQSINLSEKSIERRLKQKIEIDIYDFPVCQKYIDILKQDNVTIRHRSRWFNAVSITVNSDKILEKILNYSFVKKIQPVCKMIKKDRDEFIDDKTIYNHIQKSLSFPYGSSFNQIDMLGGVDLHEEGFLGNGITIAVFDAGFTAVETLPIFSNLWDNNKILDMYDFVDSDDDVFGGSSHGTMVLSTMGGYMIDSLIGTAPEANYMLFRTEDSDSETLVEEDNWAAAAEYADSVGVDIINSSLGYTILYDDTLNSHSYNDMDGNTTIITNAADLAASRGILVVNSAGNSGNNDWYYIGAPADGDSVLAVGAVNSFGDIASFSSRGPSFDGRVKPNVCAQGVFTVVADLDSTIRFANGTSFSAPITAGLAACLWQANTNLTNMDIFNMIEESTNLYNNPNDSLGFGIPNFYQAYLNNLSLNTEKEHLIKIYPNPFKEGFVIQSNFKEDVLIKIFDMTGTLIFSTYINDKKSNIFIDELSHLPLGIYFLKLSDSSKIYTLIKS